LFTLLLDVKLWFLPLFFGTFIFFSSVTHDSYSFFCWSLASTDRSHLHVLCPALILPLVTPIAQYMDGSQFGLR
jgi:hypothetical protein